MKILNQLVVFGLFLGLNIGCSDGEDGKVFLRIRALLEEPPSSVNIENPDIPEDFQYGVYYQTQPGSYLFSYTDVNNQPHPQGGELQHLDIVAESGKSASLFKHGENGTDLYIDLWLLSTGALVQNFDYYTVPDELIVND